MLQPTWPGTKMASSGSTPNLLSATSMSTPVSNTDLAHQHWSSATVLPMSHRPTPPLPDQLRQTDGRRPSMDSTPLSFVRQSLQVPAGLSPPLPNIRRMTTDGLGLPDDNHVVSIKYWLFAVRDICANYLVYNSVLFCIQ